MLAQKARIKFPKINITKQMNPATEVSNTPRGTNKVVSI